MHVNQDANSVPPGLALWTYPSKLMVLLLQDCRLHLALSIACVDLLPAGCLGAHLCSSRICHL